MGPMLQLTPQLSASMARLHFSFHLKVYICSQKERFLTFSKKNDIKFDIEAHINDIKSFSTITSVLLKYSDD